MNLDDKGCSDVEVRLVMAEDALVDGAYDYAIDLVRGLIDDFARLRMEQLVADKAAREGGPL